jgi:hypothetical protein
MRSSKWVLVLALPAVCVAAAQPAETVVPSGTVVKLILLRQQSVQEELKVSPDLTKKIREFTNKQYEAARAAMKLTKEETAKKVKQLAAENKQFLVDNLKPEQRKRLQQIAMQFTGLRYLTRKSYAQKLNLTPDQVSKFKKLAKDARKSVVKLFSAKDRAGLSEKFAKLHAETRAKVRGILTPAQKAKVKEIVGERFKGKIVFEEAPPATKDNSDK